MFQPKCNNAHFSIGDATSILAAGILASISSGVRESQFGDDAL